MATKAKKRSARVPRSYIKIRGFARVQIGERQPDGSNRIVGDSGWTPNAVTTDNAGGLTAYIAARIGTAIAGSKTPTHFQLATQSTAVAGSQDSLVGETRSRKALTASTVATGTLQMTGSWSSAANSGGAVTIGSIAVYNTTAGGTMGSGATFTTSQWSTNQDISATYQWRFS